MKNIIKDMIRQSVYQIAKDTVANLEQKEKDKDKENKDLKRKMLWVGTLHTLLGALYND
jgi:hypothetical protein